MEKTRRKGSSKVISSSTQNEALVIESRGRNMYRNFRDLMIVACQEGSRG